MKLKKDEFIRGLVEAARKPSATPVIFYDQIWRRANYANLIIVLANEKRRESIRNLDVVDTEQWDVVFVGKPKFPYSDLFEFDDDGEIYWCCNNVARNWMLPYLREVK